MDYKNDRQKRQETRLKARSATWEPSSRPCTLQFVFDDVPSQVERPAPPTRPRPDVKLSRNPKKLPFPSVESVTSGAAGVEQPIPPPPRTNISRSPSSNGGASKGGKSGSKGALNGYLQHQSRPIQKDSEPVHKVRHKVPVQGKKQRNNQTGNKSSAENMDTTNSHIPLVASIEKGTGTIRSTPHDSTGETSSSQSQRTQRTTQKRKRKLEETTADWTMPSDGDGSRRRKHIQFGLALGASRFE